MTNNGNDNNHSRKDDSASSSSSSIQLPPPPTFPLDETGTPVTHIPGLAYYPTFFSKHQQEELLLLIDRQPWQSGVIARRQQFYGEVYYHTRFKSSKLQPQADADGVTNMDRNCKQDNYEHSESQPTSAAATAAQGISLHDSGMQVWLERTRPFFPADQPLPSQVLINEYRNNMGIASHFEDVTAFGPTIVTISLVNPVYMTLKRPTTKTNGCDEYHDVVKILLEPGSLLVMKDEARYEYRHGIGKSKWVHYYATTTDEEAAGSDDVAANDNNKRVGSANDSTKQSGRHKISLHRDESYRRVSLTIRHLLRSRRKVEGREDEQDTIKDPSVY